MPAQLLLRYGDVQSGQLRQQRAERYLKLHPGEVCAEAEMRSIAEREMRIGVSPEVKVVGVAEDGFVVIGRAPGAKDRISRPDGHVSDLHVGQGDPGVECATEDNKPQQLLDRASQQFRTCSQLAELLRMSQERVQHVGDLVRSGLVTTDEQRHAEE